MAIADIRTKAAPVRKGPPCAVCVFLAGLSESEAAELRSILGDESIRYSLIASELANDAETPVVIAESTWARHARGKCDAKERLRG